MSRRRSTARTSSVSSKAITASTWRETQAAHVCAGAELDFERQDEVRGQIPILSQKRTDVFSTAIHLNDAALRGRL